MTIRDGRGPSSVPPRPSTVPPQSGPGSGSVPPPGPASVSEIKGVWFTTARRYVVERAGEAALMAMAARVDRSYREVLLEPLSSEWYPERALQQSIAAMHGVLAGGNDAAFVRAIEDCTRLGIHRFFQALMRIGSPVYVLRKTPAMWNHIRRGAGLVAVEADDHSAVIRYSQFPYFRDANYRLLTVGAIGALVKICGYERPLIEVTSYDWDALTVRAVYGSHG